MHYAAREIHAIIGHVSCAGPAADVAAALGLSGPASRGDVIVDPGLPIPRTAA